jgi:hypothetical protein
MQTKRCADCGEEKPWSHFYLPPSSGRPGRYCKPCAAIRAADHYRRNRGAVFARREADERLRAEGKKKCRDCDEVKPLSEFYIRSEGQPGAGEAHHYCKVCANARSRAAYRADTGRHLALTKAWRKANPERVRVIRHRQRCAKYGITPEEYDALVKSQGGACAICGRKRKLVVDHDHESGKVRGLLCDPCNLMIGRADDDPGALTRAIVYLTRSATRPG